MLNRNVKVILVILILQEKKFCDPQFSFRIMKECQLSVLYTNEEETLIYWFFESAWNGSKLSTLTYVFYITILRYVHSKSSSRKTSKIYLLEILGMIYCKY